jgi:nucleoside-diphosphate-sugar epimerase
MHLVIGAGEFLGDAVSRALAPDVPLIELQADADAETLTDAMRGVDVVHICAQAWSPARRLKYRKKPPPLLHRIVDAARHAGVRRLVLVSTADVYGPDHFTRINEKAGLKPVHPYERLKLYEEAWLKAEANDLEVVAVRPTRVFGPGEDFIIPSLMGRMAAGRLWLPAGGRTRQTFIAAADVGRACLAAAERGKPGRSYLVAGFESSWRTFLEVAAEALDIPCHVGGLPYDVAFLRGLSAQMLTPSGAALWPGLYAVDVIGKPHLYDDSQSRRDLTWSPSVGSFEQEMPVMADWLETFVRTARRRATSRA